VLNRYETNDHPKDDLTTREKEIAILVSMGVTNPEIAKILVVEIKTVERHMSNIYEKIKAIVENKDSNNKVGKYHIRVLVALFGLQLRNYLLVKTPEPSIYKVIEDTVEEVATCPMKFQSAQTVKVQ